MKDFFDVFHERNICCFVCPFYERKFLKVMLEFLRIELSIRLIFLLSFHGRKFHEAYVIVRFSPNKLSLFWLFIHKKYFCVWPTFTSQNIYIYIYIFKFRQLFSIYYFHGNLFLQAIPVFQRNLIIHLQDPLSPAVIMLPTFYYRFFNNICSAKIPQTNFRNARVYVGARGSVVGWVNMLQAGRSRVRVPMRWIFQLT
jgi:hypothetical protein